LALTPYFSDTLLHLSLSGVSTIYCPSTLHSCLTEKLEPFGVTITKIKSDEGLPVDVIRDLPGIANGEEVSSLVILFDPSRTTDKCLEFCQLAEHHLPFRKVLGVRFKCCQLYGAVQLLSYTDGMIPPDEMADNDDEIPMPSRDLIKLLTESTEEVPDPLVEAQCSATIATEILKEVTGEFPKMTGSYIFDVSTGYSGLGPRLP